MEVWYREKQVEEIAEKLRISKSDVDLILRNYFEYLQERVAEGRTVKFLNICYLRQNEGGEERLETLAYISTEIAKATGMGNVTVHSVLSLLEDIIAKDLRNGVAFSMRGVVRIRAIIEDGQCRVRVRKSTKYNSKPITVSTLNAFRRKVGMFDAG